jgi:putative transposase
VKYAFIQTNSDVFPVCHMCPIMKVSVSAYYRWLDNPISKKDLRHYELDDQIRGIFNKHKSRYGVKRVYEELKDKDCKVTEKKVSERMREMNLVAKGNKPFIVTTDSNHNQYTAPNLLKQDFHADLPNQKYVTDITYVPTAEGWLYVSVMIDLFSRMVVGWSMADNMRVGLVCDTLHMAMFRRGMPKDVIVHSDKGSQYCSEEFQSKLKEYDLISSMSGTGCCYDNAACESFFGTMKTELCDDENYQTREEAKSSIFEYIETYYNVERKHSTINYMTPKEFEIIMESEPKKCPKKAG